MMHLYIVEIGISSKFLTKFIRLFTPVRVFQFNKLQRQAGAQEAAGLDNTVERVRLGLYQVRM